MAKARHNAGHNIRKLAVKRRIESISSFISAGLVIGLPFFLAESFDTFLSQITSINPAQPKIALTIPPAIPAVLGLTAVSLVINGAYLWKRANHADQGARGEEDTAQELFQLEQEGWEIEYGMRLGNRLGDADIICISPQNKAYVIDVKSHQGTVTTDGKQLQRRIGKTTCPFEKNFLEQVMKQALQVKKQKKLSFVTPILAFSRATVSISSGQVQKVYVVERLRLASLLKSLG